jgi:hypothetical protein
MIGNHQNSRSRNSPEHSRDHQSNNERNYNDNQRNYHDDERNYHEDERNYYDDERDHHDEIDEIRPGSRNAYKIHATPQEINREATDLNNLFMLPGAHIISALETAIENGIEVQKHQLNNEYHLGKRHEIEELCEGWNEHVYCIGSKGTYNDVSACHYCDPSRGWWVSWFWTTNTKGICTCSIQNGYMFQVITTVVMGSLFSAVIWFIYMVQYIFLPKVREETDKVREETDKEREHKDKQHKEQREQREQRHHDTHTNKK